MPKLDVTSIKISDLLDNLASNAWMVPSFQRDFVWSEADVTSLVLSVLEARPIGMATLWEQPDDSDLTLVPLSIDDTQGGAAVQVTLSHDPESRPNKYFAVLDGRQRSTALAMAFGGLRATDARRRFSGRFFLDVKPDDVSERVCYLRESEVQSRQLDRLSTAIANGLFPLATDPEKGLMAQWIGFVQEIKNPANYPNNELPEDAELERRNKVLQDAFQGINDTVLAVYTVPAEYTLGEICEIFETLNTTGTKVSTVDLLHSWLYNDTSDDESPLLLRDWIEELGEIEGAVGWASKSNRPEIIAQAVTAAYVALDGEKPPPRAVGGSRRQASISSLKAGDLLATPSAFWKEVEHNQADFAAYIGDFQVCVSGAHFPIGDCPYPVTMAMYVALRWYMAHDSRFSQQWTQHELDALFRAFFWRNSLTGRYDQGFLSQSASDLKGLKEILFKRNAAANANSWAAEADNALTDLDIVVPSASLLEEQTLSQKPAGALGRALALPVRTRPATDLLDPRVAIDYPSAKPVELHHIFPLAWCSNNRHGALGEVLDPNRARYDYVKSVANLTPLTRESNNAWRAKTPGQALADEYMNYEVAADRLEGHYISKEAFEVLTAETPNPQTFWELRAQLLAADLVARCRVRL